MSLCLVTCTSKVRPVPNGGPDRLSDQRYGSDRREGMGDKTFDKVLKLDLGQSLHE